MLATSFCTLCIWGPVVNPLPRRIIFSPTLYIVSVLIMAGQWPSDLSLVLSLLLLVILLQLVYYYCLDILSVTSIITSIISDIIATTIIVWPSDL